MHYFVLSGGWRGFFAPARKQAVGACTLAVTLAFFVCMYVRRMDVRISRLLGSLSFSVNYFGDQRVGYQLRKQIMVLVDQSSNLDLLCMKRRRTDEVEGEECVGCWARRWVGALVVLVLWSGGGRSLGRQISHPTALAGVCAGFGSDRKRGGE